MVFVTGGTGLLGSHLLVELAKRGHSIRALKRVSSDLTNVKNVFDYYLKQNSQDLFNKIEWVNGDINNVSSLKDAMTGSNEVYHCAGYVSFWRKDFKKLMKINKVGTANMVNIALTLGVDKFSHVSSTAAIGRNELSPIYTESNKWVTSALNSNYAVSKYSAEMEVWRAQEEGLNVSIVNPSVILGAGNWEDSSLTLFLNVEKGIKLYTEGTNAFVDARDVAYCMVELMDQNSFGERYLTISENVCFRDLFFMIADELKVKRASIKVKPWMASIAWRLEMVRSIFRSKPKITKETAHSAMNESFYSNKKIVSKLDHQFIPIKESIKNAVAFKNSLASK
jgi:nucleoside-diphosphate-sugar epimerase